MLSEMAVGRFVTVSGVAVPAPGAPAIEASMRDRLGLVEHEPGSAAWRSGDQLVPDP